MDRLRSWLASAQEKRTTRKRAKAEKKRRANRRKSLKGKHINLGPEWRTHNTTHLATSKKNQRHQTEARQGFRYQTPNGRVVYTQSLPGYSRHYLKNAKQAANQARFFAELTRDLNTPNAMWVRVSEAPGLEPWQVRDLQDRILALYPPENWATYPIAVEPEPNANNKNDEPLPRTTEIALQLLRGDSVKGLRGLHNANVSTFSPEDLDSILGTLVEIMIEEARGQPRSFWEPTVDALKLDAETKDMIRGIVRKHSGA
jgi:hypothetical protein